MYSYINIRYNSFTKKTNYYLYEHNLTFLQYCNIQINKTKKIGNKHSWLVSFRYLEIFSLSKQSLRIISRCKIWRH